MSSYTSVIDARDDVLAVGVAVADAVNAVSTTLRTNTATDQTIGVTASKLTTAAVNIRAIRASLDATDVAALQVYDDAAVTLALWGWERDVRRSLSRMEASIQDALVVATALRTGPGQRYYTTRANDTLQSIAARFLGGWQEWPRIAAANGLKAGPVAENTTLIIPQKV